MKSIPSLLCLSLAASALAASGVDLSRLPPASTKKNVTYQTDIRPMLAESCFRCHGDKEKKAGIRLGSLEAVLAGGKEGKIVVPGNSTKSQIVIAVAQLDPETAMPPKPRQGRGPRGGGMRGPGGAQGTNAAAGEVRPPGGPGPEGQRATNAPAGGPGQRPMGPPPKPLTPDQVGLVRAWIDQGAK